MNKFLTIVVVFAVQCTYLSETGFALQSPNQTRANVFGFTTFPKEKVPNSFNAGYSMYPTIWSLVETHPGKQYQSGLFGTWMKIRTDQPMSGKIGAEKKGGLGYNSVEGGSGVWRFNRFPTITPKFQMGGVAVSFKGIANGPGFGKGKDWNVDRGRYGVAQLSNRVVFPLDGLNYKQGTFGQSFGYGYLPLPLTPAKSKTAGKDVPTGNQSWTLFVNSKTFKGPLAFFTPYFWARHSIDFPQLHGRLFDHSPNVSNRQIQMETQHIAAIHATAQNGNQYARTTRIRFPLNKDGTSSMLTCSTAYDKSALWTTWMRGSKAARWLRERLKQQDRTKQKSSQDSTTHGDLITASTAKKSDTGLTGSRLWIQPRPTTSLFRCSLIPSKPSTTRKRVG